MTHFFNQKLLAFCATAALVTGLQASAETDLDLTRVKASLGEIISSTPVQIPTTQLDVKINVNENGTMPSQFTSQLFSVAAQGLPGVVHEKLLELNFAKRNPWEPTITLVPPPAVPFHGGGLTPQYGVFISEQGSMMPPPMMMGASSVVQGDFGNGNIWFDFPQTGGMSFYQRVTDPTMPANDHFQPLASLPMVHASWQDGSAANFSLNLQANYAQGTLPSMLPTSKPLFEFVRMPHSNGGAQPALPTTVEGFFNDNGVLKARLNQAGTISNRIVQLV